MKRIKYYSVRYGREYDFAYSPSILVGIFAAALHTDNEFRHLTIYNA